MCYLSHSDKRDDFDFDIVNFPHLDGDIPISPSYMEHIYLNSSDLQEYATKLKILMIGILLFLENF